jgi:hypothetical protein
MKSAVCNHLRLLFPRFQSIRAESQSGQLRPIFLGQTEGQLGSRYFFGFQGSWSRRLVRTWEIEKLQSTNPQESRFAPSTMLVS